MIENYCVKCGRPLRDGKCEYGCDRFGNYKRYNNNKRKIKMKIISKPEKKCYYCDKTENLKIDILPTGKKAYFCPFHFQWNFYSCKSKKYPREDFSKHFMPGLIALVQKRFKPWGKKRGANE